MEKLINNFKISFTKGDTYALAIKIKNITEDLRTAYFTVKENHDDAPLIQKSLGAGIAKIDDRAYKNEKTYKLQLQAEDTINLESNVQYLYDYQVSVDNVVKTLLSGVFVVTHSVSGAGAITTATLDVEIDAELEAEFETTPATNGIEYEQDPVANAKIGEMTALVTNDKQTIVGAINETKNDVDGLKDGTTRAKLAEGAWGINLGGTATVIPIRNILAGERAVFIGSTSLPDSDETPHIERYYFRKGTLKAEVVGAPATIQEAFTTKSQTATLDAKDLLRTWKPDSNFVYRELAVVPQKRKLWSGISKLEKNKSALITLSDAVELGDEVEIRYILRDTTNDIEMYGRARGIVSYEWPSELKREISFKGIWDKCSFTSLLDVNTKKVTFSSFIPEEGDNGVFTEMEIRGFYKIIE